MPISGLSIQKKDGVFICHVDDLSNELKQLIRNQLSSIYNGFADVEETPDIYSYEYTLETFLNVYRSKTSKTQKGMIGELLAHVIINNHFDTFTPVSVLKNKEERSIRKGFDIIYFEDKANRLLYAESKSGSKPATNSCDDTNIQLLNTAKNDIYSRITSGRNYLWTTAMIDVNLTIADSKKKVDIKKMLFKDSPRTKRATSTKKNVILISVVYGSPTEKISFTSVEKFLKEKLDEKQFETISLICIQKTTFTKVADFLESETSAITV